MTVKVKYSNTYHAKLKRLQRLPKFADDIIRGYIKRDLIEIRTLFHDGIKNDTLRLERLTRLTKKQKRRQGFPRPAAPLHGKGDGSKDRSFMNMLNIQKVGNGWKLVPSRRLHWSGKLRLDELHKIHEHGAKIKRGNVIIQIKPRPALLLSYRRWLIKRRQADKAQEVRRAITDYINTANMKLLKNIEDFKNRK